MALLVFSNQKREGLETPPSAWFHNFFRVIWLLKSFTTMMVFDTIISEYRHVRDLRFILLSFQVSRFILLERRRQVLGTRNGGGWSTGLLHSFSGWLRSWSKFIQPWEDISWQELTMQPRSVQPFEFSIKRMVVDFEYYSAAAISSTT